MARRPSRDSKRPSARAALLDAAVAEFSSKGYDAANEMHATMSRALRLEYDDVDERIVEITAPSGASQDVMAAVDRVRKA